MMLLKEGSEIQESSRNDGVEFRTAGKVNDHKLNHAFLVQRQKSVSDNIRPLRRCMKSWAKEIPH